MNSRDIFAILALVTGIGVYLSTTGGSTTNTQGGGGKTIKRRHNKHRGTKSLRTKK
jgi:hypothetical protein